MTQERVYKSETLSPKIEYSADFNKLTEGDNLRGLLEGSRVFAEPWDRNVAFGGWENARHFIASAIDRDGSILDYGSANGFLLRCLQEWSKRQLEPYGVDTDGQIIKEARRFFPGIADHFFTPEEWERNKQLPRSFDVVYWSVGDNLRFVDHSDMDFFNDVKAKVSDKGRLILGFYDTKEENTKRIKALQKLGIKFSGTMENPDGEEIIAWLDQDQ